MKRILLLGLALTATLAFVALGIWQVERLAWKRDLIARVERRSHAAPVPFADAHAEEYRRVTASGELLQGKETLVQALTERGGGFWVITPLRTPRGIVLINRGFVPSKDSPRAARGAVTITGLLRLTEPGGGFLRANDPARNRWYSRDTAAIARARGLGPVPPVFVDAAASPNPRDYPIGGLTVLQFNNNHLVYAITWFALAGLSAAGAFLLIRKRA